MQVTIDCVPYAPACNFGSRIGDWFDGSFK